MAIHHHQPQYLHQQLNLKVSSASLWTCSCSSTCSQLNLYHLRDENRLTTEPTALLNHVEDILPDFNGIIFLQLSLSMSALQSVEHVQSILRIEGIVYIPEVILLWTILILIITVVWEVLDELREETKSRLVHINNLHSVELGDINSKQVLISNQLKVSSCKLTSLFPLRISFMKRMVHY